LRLVFGRKQVPARTAKEAIEAFAGFLNETLSCVTESRLQPYQESSKLFKIFFVRPAPIVDRNGRRFYISITQICSTQKRDDGLIKAHTREYSYVFSDDPAPQTHGIVSYHWHPSDFAVRDPHLHLRITQQTGYPEIERKIARAHFPTSRVCLEDFVYLLIQHYDIKPLLHPSTWKRVLRKNKDAFNQGATWVIVPKL
jgi:hypothetical protein